MRVDRPPANCRSCEHFRNDPAYLERAIPGLNALGSAYGAARAEDGICERNKTYLSPNGSCQLHTPKISR